MSHAIRFGFISLLAMAFETNALGSIVLGSIDHHAGGSHAPMVAPFGLEFLINFPSQIDPGLFEDLGENVFWRDGSTGTYDFTSRNSDVFLQFAYMVTNGFEEEFSIYTYAPGYGGNGNTYEESEWGLGRPDLIGNQIDFIRLVVHDFHIQPYNPGPPFGEGLQWEGHITWEFWGTPIPEPATLFPFALLAMFLRSRHRFQPHVTR